MKILQHCCCLPALLAFSAALYSDEPTTKPNIVVILADDMGYGDVQAFNPDSKIPTPALNGLASAGVAFKDAHSPSAVCTPTRYGLLCGRYCWRTRLKNGVLGGYSRPLLASEQQTVGSVLKSAGYKTGCFGKWHLGLGWQWTDQVPDNINFFGVAGQPGSVEYSKPITDGPINHGFDYSYIIPASLDMSPYVYIENDRVTSIPSRLIPGEKFPAFHRKGEISDDFEIIDCLDHLTGKAVDFIDENANEPQPFFLYLPLPAPHKPVVPTNQFKGKSKLGPYGDFIMQVDSTVAKVLAAIDAVGISDNTFVIFTSDNGSFMRRIGQNKADHVNDPKQQGYRADSHQPNGTLRGTKADIWEAGHRVPFIVRWPSRVPAGQQCDATIVHTDILATLAEVGQASFDKGKSEDSFSFLANAKSPSTKSVRPPVIHHSVGGMFAIREGKWKLVMGNGSGGREKPRGKNFEKPYHLFDLTNDLAEKDNVFDQHSQLAHELQRKFEAIAGGDQLKPDQPKKSHN